jgi:hypothetical protein
MILNRRRRLTVLGGHVGFGPSHRLHDDAVVSYHAVSYRVWKRAMERASSDDSKRRFYVAVDGNDPTPKKRATIIRSRTPKTNVCVYVLEPK